MKWVLSSRFKKKTICKDIVTAVEPNNEEAKELPTAATGAVGYVIDKTKEKVTGEKSDGLYQAIGDFAEALLT